MTAEEELKLVRDASSGDAGAFEAIVREHQRNVYSLAYKLTGSEQDALDASQDTFLKAYQNLRAFRGESRLSVWLYRLTYNASMDIIKKSRRDRLVPMPTDEEGVELDMPDDSPTPDEQAERREQLEAVRAAVLELDEDKREMILMREYRNMSYSDIASALKLEEGTVKSRLARARAALAEKLKKRGTISFDGQSKGQNDGTKEARRRERS